MGKAINPQGPSSRPTSSMKAVPSEGSTLPQTAPLPGTKCLNTHFHSNQLLQASSGWTASPLDEDKLLCPTPSPLEHKSSLQVPCKHKVCSTSQRNFTEKQNKTNKQLEDEDWEDGSGNKQACCPSMKTLVWMHRSH